MTDIADLLDTPQARLAYRMEQFVEELREKQKEEERQLDRLFEEKRTSLHHMHVKIQSSYKKIFDELLIKMNRNEDIEILEWFDMVVKTKRKDVLVEMLRQGKTALRDIEKNGGSLVCNIQREAESGGCGSCLWRPRKNGYFCFLDEFMDGYDDNVVYQVCQTTMSEREQKRKKEEEHEAWIKKWRAEEAAKHVTVEEAATAVEAAAGTGLFQEKKDDEEAEEGEDLVQRILKDMAETVQATPTS